MICLACNGGYQHLAGRRWQPVAAGAAQLGYWLQTLHRWRKGSPGEPARAHPICRFKNTGLLGKDCPDARPRSSDNPGTGATSLGLQIRQPSGNKCRDERAGRNDESR